MLSENASNPAVAAIKYALSNDCLGSEREFLNCWFHGDFGAIRREWENVPEDVFIGADPSLKETMEELEQGSGIHKAVREAVLVAIVECFDKHPKDVGAVFSLNELIKVRDETEHLLAGNVQVEDVYKRGFDALQMIEDR